MIRVDDNWVMLLAAALPDGAGAVLQYRSTDLTSWSYDGVLCSRPNDPTDEVWTGGLWECPQLFRLEDKWVLLVSVWDDGVLHHVAAAIGHYDGRSLRRNAGSNSPTVPAPTPARPSSTTRDGAASCPGCARNPRTTTAPVRAGAHSVVSLISLTAEGSLQLQPHPDVDALRVPVTVQTHGDRPRLVYGRRRRRPGPRPPHQSTGHAPRRRGVRVAIDNDVTQRRLAITRPGLTLRGSRLLKR